MCCDLTMRLEFETGGSLSATPKNRSNRSIWWPRQPSPTRSGWRSFWWLPAQQTPKGARTRRRRANTTRISNACGDREVRWREDRRRSATSSMSGRYAGKWMGYRIWRIVMPQFGRSLLGIKEWVWVARPYLRSWSFSYTLSHNS